ncbi:MAG: class I SAM-dependent methyltransferase [Oligoflexus sp.]
MTEQIVLRENTSKNTHSTVAQLIAVEKPQKVLDIPCGEGAFSQRLMASGYETYSADCLNLLKVDNPRFIQADMNQQLPFEESSLDAIACIDGIEHIERPFDFVRECQRVLRKDGAMVISTPNISSLRSRWRWFLTGFHNKCKSPLDETNRNPLHHINMLSYPELRYMLHTNGFRIERITANRIKPISYLYGIILPISYYVTRKVFKKEARSESEWQVSRQTLKDIFKAPVLFGETLVLLARKI